MTSILPPRLAAIDLGTNTFRLVARGIQRVAYPRIGLGVDRTGRIAPASIRRGLAALASFRRIVRSRKLRVVGVVGTSALRDAANGPAFCETVRRRFGWTVDIISGEEEADLTFSGAVSSLSIARNGLVLISDVGGGSTELIWGAPALRASRPARPDRSFRILGRVSLKLGSVRMTERFRAQGRVDRPKLSRIRSAVRRLLLSSPAPWRRIRAVVGVGGTATTLAAILHGVDPYDESQVHGAAAPIASLEKIRDVLAVMTPRERQFLPSVPKGRADIIVAGAVIQTEIAALTRAPALIASDAGILTGLILRAALAHRRQKV